MQQEELIVATQSLEHALFIPTTDLVKNRSTRIDRVSDSERAADFIQFNGLRVVDLRIIDNLILSVFSNLFLLCARFHHILS
jgi:hypothetical protein